MYFSLDRSKCSRIDYHLKEKIFVEALDRPNDKAIPSRNVTKEQLRLALCRLHGKTFVLVVISPVPIDVMTCTVFRPQRGAN